MAATFVVDIVSPEAIIWTGEATFLVARTTEGEIGIQAGHEALMGALATGSVTVDGVNSDRTTIAVHGGFIQVLDNTVTLLTDRATIVEGDSDSAREAAAVMAEEEAAEADSSNAEGGA